jgi:hypothetical protein
MPTFKIQKQVFHLAGNLLPHQPDDHKLQKMYYITDPDNTRVEPEWVASIYIYIYMVLVHNNNNLLSDIQRFFYLHSSLSDVIEQQCLQMSSDNY